MGEVEGVAKISRSERLRYGEAGRTRNRSGGMVGDEEGGQGTGAFPLPPSLYRPLRPPRSAQH